MFSIIGVVLAVAVLAILVFAATKPSSFQVQRRQAIAAAPDTIFPLINDFHHWEAWSPWGKLDPAQVITYAGAEQGVGAQYAWVGNSKVGAGKMEILGSRPVEQVQLKIEFFKPMPGVSDVTFTLVPEGPATQVTWSMVGPRPFLGRVFSVFMDIDGMIGKDFERGLASLKQVAEAR